MLKNIFKHCYRFLLYLSAFVILISAVAITVIRLALPGIGEYRQQTQDWISQTMNHPVQIKRIEADWESWTPNLRLHQVNILDPESNDLILNFDSVVISIDIFKSLLRKEITPETITVSDLDLTLIRRADGSIIASKQVPDVFSGKQSGNDSVARWFLSQNNISVMQAQVTLLGMTKNDEPLLLSDATLHIRNNDYRTQIEGVATLPDTYGDTLNFALDTNGNLMTSDWSGELYLEGKNINLSSLLKEINVSEIEYQSGTTDIKLWSVWNQAKIRQLEGQLTLDDVKLNNNQSALNINKLTSRFLAHRRTDKGYDLELNIEDLSTINGNWPETSISIKRIFKNETGTYRYVADANYLNLDDIDSVLKLFPDSLSETPLLLENPFTLSGTLKNSLVKYDVSLEPNNKLYIESEFSDLGGQFDNHAFKFAGVNGHVQGTRSQGNLRITSNISELMLQELLTQPLTLYELNTDLNWRLQDKELWLSTALLDTHTQDFDLKLKGKLKFEQDRPKPFIDIVLELTNLELEKFANYLPTSTPEKTKAWLARGLLAGTVPSANFVFRGWLDEYPFKNNEGSFQGYAVANQATLDYNPDWPPIYGINAGIIVDADKLTVEATSGSFFDANIKQASAIIDNLASQDVKKSFLINGHIDGEISDAMSFIKNSPLQNNLSLKNLSSQNIYGGMGLDLSLDIPLYQDLTKVDGKISLYDATYDPDDIGINLTNINGDINFTRDSVSARNISASYLDKPVHLAIESSDGAPIKSTLSGKANSQFISQQLLRNFPTLEWLKPQIEKRITGTCEWQASIIHTDTDNESGAGKQLLITSTLNGLSIDLPSPLSKNNENTPIELAISFPGENKRKINIQYANILEGNIDINEINGEQFVTTSLAFGDKAVTGKQDKQLSITGNIDHLVVSEWLEFISDSPDKISAKPGDKAISMDVQIGTLEFMNQNFSTVNMKLENIKSDYHLNFDAENIQGDIHLSSQDGNTPVKVNLSKLKLVNDENESKNEINYETQNEQKKIIPTSIPPLDIHISSLIYNESDLGQMNLLTSKIKNGLSVDKLNFTKTDMTITGAGVWNMINNQHRSNFKLALNATSMKTMLETFNYDVTAIEEAKTNLTLNARWLGTPADFSLTNLSGTLDMEIDKGRFTDIDPSAGRLFGLLSLQTLPRRLSLDFSDLFGKGLTFDSIDGHFSIEDGNAYTNNLAMTGPSVNINISGRTGLAEQDYDQVATVTPKISDSLPVASALFGPVGVGVGAVIFLAGEIFQSIPDKINTLLSKQYSITGAWNDPHVTKINQNDEDNNNG